MQSLIAKAFRVWCLCLFLYGQAQASTCAEFTLTHDQDIYHSARRGVILGAGKSGYVFLGEENGTAIVYKLYRAIEFFERDLKMMRFLREKSAGCAPTECLIVPEVSGIQKSLIMTLPAIRGTDVHKLLTGPGLSAEEKNDLREKYLKLCDQLIDTLKRKAGVSVEVRAPESVVAEKYFSDKTEDGLPLFFISAKELIHQSMILKSDNVILENGTGLFYLVDPK